MAEIHDWNGPWTPELIREMLGEAGRIEARRLRDHHLAIRSAIAASFDKRAGKEARKMLADIDREDDPDAPEGPAGDKGVKGIGDFLRAIGTEPTTGKKINRGRLGGSVGDLGPTRQHRRR